VGKSIILCSFAGVRLTSSETQLGFQQILVDVSGIFLKPQVVKSLLFSVRVLTYIMEFNACHDKSIHNIFDLFCVFIDDAVRVCVDPWRGFKFSVS